MKVLKIAKGGGKFRTIYAPGRSMKRRLQRLLPTLMEYERAAAKALGVEQVAHGFVKDRNPVTCATPHRSYAVTVSMDFKDWFDSVPHHQIAHGLDRGGCQTPYATAASLCYEGRPRQGLPTSPVACNLAAVWFDYYFSIRLSLLFDDFAYTRYADDMTVSMNSPFKYHQELIVATAKLVAQSLHWQLADHKTRIQLASAGKRVIVGIAVDDRVGPTRESKRKLRAARHQARANQSRGLAEWVACKLPRSLRRNRTRNLVVSGGKQELVVPTPVATAAVVHNQAAGIRTVLGRRLVVPEKRGEE